MIKKLNQALIKSNARIYVMEERLKEVLFSGSGVDNMYQTLRKLVMEETPNEENKVDIDEKILDRLA